MSSLKVNEVAKIPRPVTLLWPRPDTRIPVAQRAPLILDGVVDCDYALYSQEEAEQLDAQVDAGEMTSAERFALLVPDIRGLPLGPEQTPHQWLAQHKYGSVVRNAIWEDYQAFLAEGRSGNSKKRR